MGLKVLLADDSAAIKKVVQICLQDFGLELKTIGTGKEAVALAKSFKPDVALIDVMLPHKSGYDVALEIKNDSSLQKTPVIMLWSSFMELDEAKFKNSKAEGKLEKPFEASDLRALITKLVPKTQENPLLNHLELPKINEKKKPAENWSMSSFEDIGKFSETLKNEPTKVEPPADSDSEWVRKDLGKFKVNIDTEGMEDNTVSFHYDESALKNADFIMKAEVGSAKSAEPEPPAASPAVTPSTPPEPLAPAPTIPEPAPMAMTPTLNLESPEIKSLIEKQIKEQLEKAIWKIVPDLATQMIKEEIQRLTSEN